LRIHIKPLIVALSLVISFGLLTACGDDDGDGGTSPSESAEASGEPVETPAGSPGEPEECTVSEEEIGLVSKLDFATAGGEFGQGGQFPAGEPIDARMRLINCTDDDSTLYFDTTQRYEMTIELENPLTEVFRSSDGVEFAPTPGTEVLQPSDTIVYEQPWDQTDKEGNQVGPGIYRVAFLSVGCGSDETAECPPFGPISRIEILE
jgi:hypothetical protein